MTVEAAQERRVWDLLVKNVDWEVPADHPVKIYDRSGESLDSASLQIFELAVTTILAHMRPEFAWWVTPNRQDDGLDFMGVHRFLDDSELGIAAAITVGGQCKKRTTVKDVVAEVAGSLIRMADVVNPTFFVVAFSARLTPGRVEKARGMLERQCQRHCHILDRDQIEGLLGDYLDPVTEIFHGGGLSDSEVDEVLSYLRERVTVVPAPSVSVTPPRRVLAGVPFRVDVNVRWTHASHSGARLWWRQQTDHPDAGAITLIGPVGADGPAGVALVSEAPTDDPLGASCAVELTTYTVGRVDLGEVLIGLDKAGPDSAERITLGGVDVVENMRPRFFDRPYRPGLARLSEAYERVRAGIATSVGVTGAGGSGKSRLCEEFALEKRRRGCGVVAAKHPKTHEAPHRIVADLFTGLAAAGPTGGDPADDVLRAVDQYDPSLASGAAPAIRSIFGTSNTGSAATTEQSVVSALLLLIVARCRNAPLIIHLQDLHWCSADVLLLLERLVRQLGQVGLAQTSTDQQAGGGVLFLFEGRVRESGDSGGEAWSSAPFEAFLQRADSTTVTCSSFTHEDGLSFAQLLFEGRHNAHRLLADDLLLLQGELIERVHATAGGNPFHTLEQVRLLKELGVLGQNPKTGLLYMIRPEPVESVLPESVFAAVQLRWQYMRNRAPELALLLWGSALLDDQIPAPLFNRLWRELAPDVSVRDIDGTDILWTGDGMAHEVVFRHENYFESLRRFTVSEPDRRRVVDAYCDWFAGLRRPGPADRFRWARVLLELPDPDISRARALLGTAVKASRKSGDLRLARRILAFHLDLAWSIDERSSLPTTAFLRHCDDEIGLCRDLLSFDRGQAGRRIRRMHQRIDSRVGAVGDAAFAGAHEGLLLRLLTADAINAQVLFNDRRPAQSAEIAGRVVDGARTHRLSSPVDASWESLEMEALYTQSCAQAISGEFGPAVRSSAAAAAIARRSPSQITLNVVSTYGSMLLSEDPKAGEAVLRECLASWPEEDSSAAFLVHVHLSMALVLQAHRCRHGSARRRALLAEAGDRMARVHDACRRLGLYPDAGAAALVRGVVSAVAGDGHEASWFAQGVAAAARGRQMETLWRSHINLATALRQKDGRVTQTGHDHALAALEIMQDSLSAHSDPERSPRFEMLRMGMASAVSMLLASGDDAGVAVLERYPRLRAHFLDPEAGVLAAHDGGPRHFQWLQVDGVDYILY